MVKETVFPRSEWSSHDHLIEEQSIGGFVQQVLTGGLSGVGAFLLLLLIAL